LTSTMANKNPKRHLKTQWLDFTWFYKNIVSTIACNNRTMKRQYYNLLGVAQIGNKLWAHNL
jgi:hypothetical protein